MEPTYASNQKEREMGVKGDSVMALAKTSEDGDINLTVNISQVEDMTFLKETSLDQYTNPPPALRPYRA